MVASTDVGQVQAGYDLPLQPVGNQQIIKPPAFIPTSSVALGLPKRKLVGNGWEKMSEGVKKVSLRQQAMKVSFSFRVFHLPQVGH